MATLDEETQVQVTMDLLARANEAGIDVEAHRCGCFVCQRTSLLCPASAQSLADELRGVS